MQKRVSKAVTKQLLGWTELFKLLRNTPTEAVLSGMCGQRQQFVSIESHANGYSTVYNLLFGIVCTVCPTSDISRVGESLTYGEILFHCLWYRRPDCQQYLSPTNNYPVILKEGFDGVWTSPRAFWYHATDVFGFIQDLHIEVKCKLCRSVKKTIHNMIIQMQFQNSTYMCSQVLPCRQNVLVAVCHKKQSHILYMVLF